MPKYIVELWLDGYNTEEEMEKACSEFIYDQLNMTASAVTIEEYNEQDELKAQLARCKEIAIEYADETDENMQDLNEALDSLPATTKQDAEILRCARAFVALYDGVAFNGESKIHSITADLINAVRAREGQS